MEDLINKLSISKEYIISTNLVKYLEMFKPNTYMQSLFNSYMKGIRIKKSNYSDEYAFYHDVLTEFASNFIPQLILDYGQFLDNDASSILLEVADGRRIKILKPNEALELGLVSDSKYDGAFTKDDIKTIFFTPNVTNKGNEDDIYRNTLKMLGSMIHLTFHLIVNVTKPKEYNTRYNDKLSILSGFILNEGIVEQLTQEFANKHSYIYNPDYRYFHYVDFTNALKDRLQDNYYNMIFTSDYEQILKSTLSEREYSLYQTNELLKYFEKMRISQDMIIYNNEEEVNQKQAIM